MSESTEQKELGNKHFAEGRFAEAAECYTSAIKLATPEEMKEKGVYHKNRAACYLKLGKYEKALSDASKALEAQPNDTKALFRKALAEEQLGKLEDAYKDAMMVLHLDPKNTAVLPPLRRLREAIENRAKESLSTAKRLQDMIGVAFDEHGDIEKRRTAINNIFALCKDESGSARVFAAGYHEKVVGLLDTKDAELILGALRVLAKLCENHRERALVVYEVTTLSRLCHLVGSANEDVSAATANLMKNLLFLISRTDVYLEKERVWEERRAKHGGQGLGGRPQFSMEEDAVALIDPFMHAIVKLVNSSKVSGLGRDNIIELLVKVVSRERGMWWTRKFLFDTDGITRLLEVGSRSKDSNLDGASVLKFTENTRMNVSLLLHRIYDDLLSDQERDKFRQQCLDYMTELFADESMDTKVEAMVCLAVLLQGPFDVGSSILGTQGVMEVMLAMAQTDVVLCQRVAVEALVHAASRRDKCTGIIKQAVPILKKLYNSDSDYIKVRALVGLCKLGSFGGTDASAKSLAEGSTFTLAKACRKFLTNPAKDIDLRKWAAEGMAYLTLDADVKESFVEDTKAIHSVVDLPKVADKSVHYALSVIFVNLTNSYNKPEVEPELIELAKFSKQHVPEEHPKDKEEFVKDRIFKLSAMGLCNALVVIANGTTSDNTREQVARVFCSVSTYPELRGLIVQQGGGKSLLPLTVDNSAEGRKKAAHALAKIAVTMDPQVAFPGQRMLEVVRPLIKLLGIEYKAVETYEALLALTNLASLNDHVRRRICKEQGVPDIEHWMYDEHPELKRSSLECMCNMVMNEEVAKGYAGENDRVKLWVLYLGEAGDEDEDASVTRACSGGLAMLAERDPGVICHKIAAVNNWLPNLQKVCIHPLPDIQHRGMSLLRSIVECDRELARVFVESPLLELVMAIAQLDEEERRASIDIATAILEKCREYELIQRA